MDSAIIDIYTGVFGPYTFTEYLAIVKSEKTLYHSDELSALNLLILSDQLPFYVKDYEIFPKEVVVMKYIEQQNEEYYVSDNQLLVNVLVKRGDGRVLRILNKDIYIKTLGRIKELEKKQTHTDDSEMLKSITDEIERLSSRKKQVSKWFIEHHYESDIMSPKSSKSKKTKISGMRDLVGGARKDKEENAEYWKKKIYAFEPKSGSRSGMLCRIKEETKGKFDEGGMAWYKNKNYYFSVGRPKKN